MKILAIHAHPDDVEFLAAGTLALLHQHGHEIHIATLSPGDKGSETLSNVEIAAIRREEAKRSASILNASYTCLEMPDFEIFDNHLSRQIVTDFVRSIQPNIILTASPVDYMADHEAAATLVRNASFVAGIRNYQTMKSKALDGIPALYYMDPIEGTDHFGNIIKPEFCVDISSTINVKESMVACHESQREWLRKHHGVDQYIISMKHWSSQRGEYIGVNYAEGFRQHKGHAYPKENILENCLPKKSVQYL
jgi:LmbE family N-acetylglucosaminyl deacetylase